jgi:hypothetical protein
MGFLNKNQVKQKSPKGSSHSNFTNLVAINDFIIFKIPEKPANSKSCGKI